MHKSLVAHYRNKYPGGSVIATEGALDVYDSEGGHRVALRKNGANQLVCVSKEMGCSDVHDLSPIPKDARVFKVYPDGMIGRSEEADERESVADELAAHECGGHGKVPSIQELHMHLNPELDKNSGFSASTTWASMRPASAAGEQAVAHAPKKRKSKKSAE